MVLNNAVFRGVAAGSFLIFPLDSFVQIMGP